MKFFTPQFSRGPLRSGHFERVYARYREHLERLRGVLPDRVLELAELRGVEDGLIVRVDHDREQRRLRLILRCGDLQKGYYNLVLIYEEADILPEHDLVLARLARGTKSQRIYCDLLHHEIDADKAGRVRHSLLMWANPYTLPGAEDRLCFSITCRSLKWRREPRRSRRLPSMADRYPNDPQI